MNYNKVSLLKGSNIKRNNNNYYLNKKKINHY